MMERVQRCYVQMWEVSDQILTRNGNIVLALGFTTKEQRELFLSQAQQVDVNAEIHCLNASKEIREKRTEKRNIEKDPSVYSFDVTEMMFNFMEPRFEVPSQEKLKNCLKIDT